MRPCEPPVYRVKEHIVHELDVGRMLPKPTFVPVDPSMYLKDAPPAFAELDRAEEPEN